MRSLEVRSIKFSFYGSNAYVYVVSSGKEHLLIDSGASWVPKECIFPTLKRWGISLRKIRFLVNTHAHIDHCGGNYDFKKRSRAEVLAHELDIPWTRDHDKQFLDRFASFPELYLVTEEVRDAYHKDIGMEVEVDKSLREMDKISLGDDIFTIIHTPGHSPGSICLFNDDEKMLISGDAVQGMGPQASPARIPMYADLDSYLATLDKLSKLEVNCLYAAHHFNPFNKNILKGKEVRELLEVSRKAAERIGKEILGFLHEAKSPKSLGEVAKFISMRFGGAWQSPLTIHQLHSTNAHLMSLHKREEVIQADGLWSKKD